jgi:hypothetical protein
MTPRPADQQHIQQYLSTGSGIEVATRELLTLSVLISLGGCEQ